MVFSLEFDKPLKEEILAVKRLAKNNSEELNSRELWGLEYVSENSEDDFDDEVVE